ncbi:Surface Antigen Variable Number Repeat-Containing Protein [Bacteroidales bacterium CF]|jgi:hypothetical protein|nr:Surface Antigen Variable Number Repeat-Containing Protein [Bacteroidales bacterium CF]
MRNQLISGVLFLLLLLLPDQLSSQTKSCISNIYTPEKGITKKEIILRELPFKTGDSVEIENIEKLLLIGKENLINLSLFNFVYLNYEYNKENPHNIDIYIETEERWYIWPLINVVLEDRNMTSWLKRGDMGRVTLETGIKAYNLWGLNHTLSVSLRTGYQRGLRFEYNNISLDREQKFLLNVSAIREYSRTENVRIENNTPFYYKSDEFIIDKYTYLAGITYRPRLRISHIINIGVDKCDISNTILTENPDYWGTKDTLRTGFFIKYKYSSDQRDNNQYPLNGYMISGEFNGYASFDNDIRYAQISSILQYCQPIGDRWNISAILSAGISAKNRNAYIFDKAIGYENAYLRGMELYVADGQHYSVLNPTLKYNIIPTKVVTIDWLSFLKKFSKIHFALYGKAFTDFGYVCNKYRTLRSNNLSNKFLYSTGIGLDFVTYYDINLSIEYSFNMLNKGGLFFTFKGPLI